MSDDGGWPDEGAQGDSARYGELMGQLSWIRRVELYVFGAAMVAPAPVYLAAGMAIGTLVAVLVRTGTQWVGDTGFWVTGFLIVSMCGFSGLLRGELCKKWPAAAFGRRIGGVLLGVACAVAMLHRLDPDASPYPAARVEQAWIADEAAARAMAPKLRFDWSKGRVAVLLDNDGVSLCPSNAGWSQTHGKDVPDLSVEATAFKEAQCGDEFHAGTSALALSASLCALDFMLGMAWEGLAVAWAWMRGGGVGAALRRAWAAGKAAAGSMFGSEAWILQSGWRRLRQGSASWARALLGWSIVGFGRRAVRGGAAAIQAMAFHMADLLGAAKELIVERALADPGRRAALEREALNRSALKGKPGEGRQRL